MRLKLALGLYGAIGLALGGCAKPTEVPATAGPYDRFCAVCHGNDGEGRPDAGAPRLNSPEFLGAASDEYLRETIAQGRPGTTMTAFSSVYGGPIEPDEIETIVQRLREWGGPFTESLPTPPPGDASAGATIYDLRCAACHGSRGVSPQAPDLANPVYQNLASDAFIAHAIRVGRPGTAMASFSDLTDAAVGDLVAYVRYLGTLGASTPSPAPR